MNDHSPIGKDHPFPAFRTGGRDRILDSGSLISGRNPCLKSLYACKEFAARLLDKVQNLYDLSLDLYYHLLWVLCHISTTLSGSDLKRLLSSFMAFARSSFPFFPMSSAS